MGEELSASFKVGFCGSFVSLPNAFRFNVKPVFCWTYVLCFLGQWVSRCWMGWNAVTPGLRNMGLLLVSEYVKGFGMGKQVCDLQKFTRDGREPSTLPFLALMCVTWHCVRWESLLASRARDFVGSQWDTSYWGGLLGRHAHQLNRIPAASSNRCFPHTFTNAAETRMEELKWGNSSRIW